MPINPQSTAVGPKSIRSLLREGAILLDVRTEEEFVGAHLRSARNVPYEELDACLFEIRKWNVPVIVYSQHGKRSCLATIKLRHYGIPAYDGGARDALREELI